MGARVSVAEGLCYQFQDSQLGYEGMGSGAV